MLAPDHELPVVIGTGKSASLMNLKDPTGVIYLNCEDGKELPFPAKFQIYNVVDPKQVRAAIQKAEDMDEIHTIVIDSLTFMMDMYESLYCVDAKDGRKAWGQYAQFFKKLMMTLSQIRREARGQRREDHLIGLTDELEDDLNYAFGN